MGEYGLNELKIDNRSMYNRNYTENRKEVTDGFIPTEDFKLDRGGEPYYSPLGWRRVAIDIGLTGEEFDLKYNKWPIAYHGTRSSYVMSILEQGFLPSSSPRTVYLSELRRDCGWLSILFLSPSIEYCGHRRYAEPLMDTGCIAS